MNVPSRILCGLMAALFFCLPGCSKTEVASIWKAENMKRGPMERVMVVGMCADPSTRELFESVFALELLKRKISAVTGYETFPSDQLPAAEAVKEKCRELNLDSVLIVRAISQQEAPTFQPPPSFEGVLQPAPFDAYLTKSTAMGIEIGSFKRRMNIRLQTRVFDMATQTQIWSAKTNTVHPESIYDLVDEFSEEIVNALKKDGIIGR